MPSVRLNALIAARVGMKWSTLIIIVVVELILNNSQLWDAGGSGERLVLQGHNGQMPCLCRERGNDSVFIKHPEVFPIHLVENLVGQTETLLHLTQRCNAVRSGRARFFRPEYGIFAGWSRPCFWQR